VLALVVVGEPRNVLARFGRDAVSNAHEAGPAIGPGGSAGEHEPGLVAQLDLILEAGSESEATEPLRAVADALRRSNETLRAIVENAPVAIYAFGGDGKIVLWNPACEEIFGWAEPEVIGRFSRVVREEDLEEANDVRDRVMAGEVIQPTEARRLTKWGHEIDVSFAAAPMRDEHGSITAVLELSANITAQKASELALRESEERFRALVDNASVIITIVEADGTVRYTSPSSHQIFGYPTGFGADRNAFQLVHPYDLPRVLELFETAKQQQGLSETAQFRMRNAAGEWRVVEAVANNLLDEPAVEGIVITARDVTEQRNAEEALRANEERFRALVENLSEVVTIVDSAGHTLWSSPAIEQILGIARDDYETDSYTHVHPDDRARVRAAIRAQLDAPDKPEPVEFRARHVDGSWRHLESVVRDLSDVPAVGGLVVTTRDITEHREAEARMRASEDRYRGIVEDQTDLICRFQADGTMTFVNQAYARFFGTTVEALVGTSFEPRVPEEDRARLQRALGSLGPRKPVTMVEHQVALDDGRIRWQQWAERAVLDEHGEVVEYQAVGRDVTKQRRAEALVVDQARILETIAKGAPLTDTLTELCHVVEAHIPDGRCSIMVLDDDGATLRHGAAPSLPTKFVQGLDGTIVGPNAGSSGRAAFRGEQVIVTDIEHDPLWDRSRELAAAHGLRACWATPIVASGDDRVRGTVAMYHSEPTAPTREQEHLVSMAVQLASIAIERKEFEAQLAHQAHHDPLTGLPNRALFLEFLMLALARARRYHTTVAVLFLDLDRFKFVNDSLGHDAGDALLVSLGERLRGVLRPGDTVARFGGDEFTVLCEDLSGAGARHQAIEVAERLLEVMQQPFLLEGEEQFLSASIGIALGATGGERPDELLRDADSAMYRAKERGKGRWEVFDEAMRESAIVRLETENLLHRAIERGEFRVFYQPIISLTETRCVGAEALVRWQHPERGLVPPYEFINLAEETGMIVPMGDWVLNEACRQGARWKAERPDAEPFCVAVNLSGRQLAYPGLANQVSNALEESGFDAPLLCLEITESVLMEDAEATIVAIKALKALGVRLSIDDFGTGYSSLGYLKRFPVDLVKVDRSFVDGLGTEAEDSAIVAAVVSLGHALGLRVVAEGVETELQLAELIALGCDEAQGFYFAPPQSAPDLSELIARSRPWRPPGTSVMKP
jgi:diguanylate cyclase (GGDEF)-like protein/PAS domain S-box-containing protein